MSVVPASQDAISIDWHQISARAAGEKFRG
jgi:hypothetical protein